MAHPNHVLENIMGFNSKLNEFWASGKYCDTVILVDGKSFNCHRLILTTASEYFDAMFGGNFNESINRTNPVILEDIDALAFQEILRFFYTGDAVLTAGNIYEVLRASDFFKLNGITELCSQFIQQNLPTLPRIFRIFSFASLIGNNSPANSLSQYIMQHFDEVWDENEFLKLSFEDLNKLTSHHWYLSSENCERFLKAIVAWINYESGRDHHREELLGKIEFRFIFNNCLQRSFMEKYPNFRIPEERIPDLYIYSSCQNQNGQNKHTEVMISNRNNLRWSTSCVINSTYRSLECTRFGNYLYCLSKEFSERSIPHDFRACPTADVSLNCSDNRILKSPPVLLRSKFVRMCSIQNNIYLSCAVRRIEQGAHSLDSDFSLDEIGRGIYSYNTDIDKWFPVPFLGAESDPQRVTFDVMGSPITADDNVLYLLKSSGTLNDGDQHGISILALDYRTSKWQESATNCYNHERLRAGVGCCVHKGKIYMSVRSDVYSGLQEIEMLRYDIIAGKWEKIESVICEQRSSTWRVRKLLSYGNSVWAFGRNNYKPYIRIYNSNTEKWYSSPISESSLLGENNEILKYYKDVVLFNPS